MNNTETLTLIDGTYNHQEAEEILLSFFNSKINFNKIKNLSSHVQLAKEDELSKKRIQDLSQSVETLKEIFAEAKKQNKRLTISSKVIIQLTDNN